MKKIASLFLLVLVLFSCTTDVTDNDPALEGLKNDVRWRGLAIHAELLPNLHLRIIGETQYEKLTLTTTNKTPATYTIGVNNNVTATFENSLDGVTFTTGAGVGDGIIEITEYDEFQMTVSGNFRFNAVNADDNPAGEHIVNFQHGVFYRVPVVPAL